MSINFNPLDHPVCFDLPERLAETAWAGHIPFAMYLISAAKPKTFVELGSYQGVSYCAFCQTVKKLETGTKCFAIDTWQGDNHAGQLEKSVFEDLKEYHNPIYGDFSKLVQSTFDDALSSFKDGSVDLLHIDGFHTFEAVSHDFDTWLPKMSEKGVVLFHDTNVRDKDFGVWKFWDEVTKKYPHFEFLHSHGLGVLAVGKDYPKELDFLFSADEELIDLIRKTFSRLGSGIEFANPQNILNKEINRLKEFEQLILNSTILRKYYFIKENGVAEYLKLHKGNADNS